MKFLTQKLVSGKIVQNLFLNINLKTEFILDLPFRSYGVFSPPARERNLSFFVKIVCFFIEIQLPIILALGQIKI